VVAGKHVNTGSKKKNTLSHFTLICYTFCFRCNQLHNLADTMEEAYANFSILLFFHRRLGTQWFPSLKHILYLHLLWLSSFFGPNINFVQTMYNHLKKKDIALHRIIWLILDSGLASCF
jgi:hypothetical protein